jgi:hypothetical protein
VVDQAWRFSFPSVCSSKFRGFFLGGGINHKVPDSRGNNRCRTVEITDAEQLKNTLKNTGTPELIERCVFQLGLGALKSVSPAAFSLAPTIRQRMPCSIMRVTWSVFNRDRGP